MDREKVIERLEYCAETRDGYVRDCVNDAIELIKNLEAQLQHACECYEEAEKELKKQEHKDKMFHALEEDWKRLKEQEAIKPEWYDGTPFCGNCGHRLEKKNRNMKEIKCPTCGKAVKWDD